MKRALAVISGAVLTVTLTACGSTDPKVEILDGVRSAAIDSGLTQEQASCIVHGLRELSVDQLNAIGDNTADAATTQQYTMVAAQCLLAG